MASIKYELRYHTDQVRRVGDKLAAFIILNNEFAALVRVAFQFVVFLL